MKKSAAAPDGLAPKTVRNVHVMLRRCLRDAVAWEYLPRNPATAATPPAVRRTKRKVWTAAQLRTFISHAEDDRFAAVRKHLKKWRQRKEFGHTSDLIFCWEDGTPVHPQTITDRFFRLAQAAKLPHIRLHDVRHSYATAALKAGVHPKIVSERLGHASVAFTLQTYSHVIEGMDDEAANTIAEHILGATDEDDDQDDDDQDGASPLAS